MEIGIDIEQNNRFKDFSAEKLNKIFTQKEIDYAMKFIDYEKHFCAFWCVKEAVIKAFSNKMLNFKDIQIDHAENGKPFLIKTPQIKNELERVSLNEIKISISHSKDYSVATCLIY